MKWVRQENADEMKCDMRMVTPHQCHFETRTTHKEFHSRHIIDVSGEKTPCLYDWVA